MVRPMHVRCNHALHCASYIGLRDIKLILEALVTVRKCLTAVPDKHCPGATTEATLWMTQYVVVNC